MNELVLIELDLEDSGGRAWVRVDHIVAVSEVRDERCAVWTTGPVFAATETRTAVFDRMRDAIAQAGQLP